MFLTATGEAFKPLHVPPLGRVELVAWIQRTPRPTAQRKSQRNSQRTTAVTWAAAAKVEFVVASFNGIEAPPVKTLGGLSVTTHAASHAALGTLRIMTPLPGASLRPPVSVHLAVDFNADADREPDPARDAARDELRARIASEPDARMVCYAAADHKHCLKIGDGNPLPSLGKRVTFKTLTFHHILPFS